MAIAGVQKGGSLVFNLNLTGVSLGHLIVVGIEWWDSSGTPTLSDGTNAPDGYSNVVTGTRATNWRFGYWLSSPKTGSVTYTWSGLTGGGGATFVFECSYSGTLSLDNRNNGATGTGTVGTSASASSSQTSMVAFGAMSLYNANSLSSATIDGVAVDDSVEENDAGNAAWGVMTMRVMNNPGSYTSVITGTTSDSWTADSMAFFETAASDTLHPATLL